MVSIKFTAITLNISIVLTSRRKLKEMRRMFMPTKQFHSSKPLQSFPYAA